MNRLGRIVFYAFIAVLWTTIVCMGAEGWVRWRWRRIESRNPFVLSRTHHVSWPVPDAQSNAFSPFLLDENVRAQFRGRGKSTVPLAQPTPRQEMAWRIPLFLELEESDRFVFSNVYDLHIFLVREDGEVAEAFSLLDYTGGDMLDVHVGSEDAPRLLDALRRLHDSSEALLFVDGTDPVRPGLFGYCLVAAANPSPKPDQARSSWLLFPKNETRRPPEEDTLWDLPFFTYRKHVERGDHISVLGITEDYKMNNYGFRDADVVTPKPEGTFRILCIGASTTEEGPINSLSYPAILETLLNRHFDTDRIDVVNGGISGMNSLKHRLRLADYFALEPDMLVIYNAVNDICHDLFPIWIKEASPTQQRLRESFFVQRYLWQLLLPDEQRMLDFINDSKMWNLEGISREAADRGVAVALCSFAAPSPELLSSTERDYYEFFTALEWGGRYSSFGMYLYALDLYNAQVRRIAREQGLIYVPVAETLRSGAALFGDICHLRNAGIERKAEIVFEALAPHVAAALTTSQGEESSIHSEP